MPDRDVEKWRLRGEEYRAIGADAMFAEARNAFEAMALHCDWMASQLVAVRDARRLSATDCLSYAQQCDALAPRLGSELSRRQLRDVAEQWRRLAQWDAAR